MATTELLLTVSQWLHDLRYPHPTSSQTLQTFLRGDFGNSVIWFSLHAVGRRNTAHVKNELHKLRNSKTLSERERDELGLGRWDEAVRKTGILREEDATTSEVLAEELEKSRKEAMENSNVFGERMRRERHLVEYEEMIKDMEETGRQLDLLKAYIVEWSAKFESSKEISLDCLVSQTKTCLEEDISSMNDLTPPPATPLLLSSLLTSLSKETQQLETLVNRHETIRPPPPRFVSETTCRLQKRCVDLSELSHPPSSQPPPPPPSPLSRRDELIRSIRVARERRTAVERGTAFLREESGAGVQGAEVDVEDLGDEVRKQEKKIQDLLQMRVDTQSQLGLFNELPSISPYLDRLATLEREVLDPYRARKDEGEKRFESGEFVAEEMTENWGKTERIYREGKRALMTAALLHSSTSRQTTITKAQVGKACDALAESRRSLESSRPALELELGKKLKREDLEEAVRLRKGLLEGNHLPQKVAEEWRKLERGTR